MTGSVNDRLGEGYPKPSAEEFRREGTRAVYNDKGQENSSLAGNHLNVSEERRYFDSDNSSIQSVELTNGLAIQNPRRDHNPAALEPSAILHSTRNGEWAQLIGQADGNVLLCLRAEGGETIFYEDITQVAAAAGITAAGIRRTQQDIASDGEVSRPEQQRIIETINRAKTAAGLL